mgnify:FL=1
MSQTEQRPDRYPVKITMKNTGKGLTCPREGHHFTSANEPYMIGVAEGSLKYWVIDGKIVKGNPITLKVTDKDINVEAVFSEETPPNLSLKEVEPVIEKDIKTTEGISLTHEDDKGKSTRRNIRKTKEKEE